MHVPSMRVCYHLDPKLPLGCSDNTSRDRFPSSWILGIKFAYKRVMYVIYLLKLVLELPSGIG